MDWFVYGVAVLLLASVALFVKVALFDKRPQKTGLVFTLLSVPLFLIYYADRWPFGDLMPIRTAIGLLDNLEGANTEFPSDVTPAFIIAALVLVHMTVFQRIAVRRRLQRIHNPIANFFASAVLAALAGGVLVSTFAWGWVGAIIVTVTYTLVYLGALALLASIIEIFVELGKLIIVWLKRQAFTLATWVTRAASFISSLSGRLGLNSLADRIRAATDEQENIFVEEQDLQDRELFEAFVRDRARQRRMRGEQATTDESDDYDTAGDDEPATPAAAAQPEATDAAADVVAEATAVVAEAAEAANGQGTGADAVAAKTPSQRRRGAKEVPAGTDVD